MGQQKHVTFKPLLFSLTKVPGVIIFNILFLEGLEKVTLLIVFL